MKKILCILLSILIMRTASFAQNKDAKKPAKKEAVKPAAATDTRQPQAKPEPTAKMKKDGTPDKRFKENKTAKPAPGPLKKDGTPDMRYKANKEAAKKK